MSRKEQRLVIIREEHTDVCSIIERYNDSECPDVLCSSAIISYFVYRTKQKRGHYKQVEIENNIRAKHGLDGSEIEAEIWIWETQEKLRDELMGLFGLNKIAKSLQWLVDNRVLSRRNNPNYEWDRTYQYSLNENYLEWIVFHSENLHSLELNDHSLELKNHSCDYKAAIPKLSYLYNKRIDTTYLQNNSFWGEGLLDSDSGAGQNEFGENNSKLATEELESETVNDDDSGKLKSKKPLSKLVSRKKGKPRACENNHDETVKIPQPDFSTVQSGRSVSEPPPKRKRSVKQELQVEWTNAVSIAVNGLQFTSSDFKKREYSRSLKTAKELIDYFERRYPEILDVDALEFVSNVWEWMTNPTYPNGKKFDASITSEAAIMNNINDYMRLVEKHKSEKQSFNEQISMLEEFLDE